MDIQDKKIKIEFDESLKFNDLVAIKLKLESRDVFITYDHMEFNKQGYLETLTYDVKNKNKNQKVAVINRTL